MNTIVGTKTYTLKAIMPTPQLKINFVFHNFDYNVITSLTAALAYQYFCEACHITYNNKGRITTL